MPPESGTTFDIEINVEETTTSRWGAGAQSVLYQAELDAACAAVISADADTYRTAIETCEKFIWRKYVEYYMSPCQLDECVSRKHLERSGGCWSSVTS